VVLSLRQHAHLEIEGDAGKPARPRRAFRARQPGRDPAHVRAQQEAFKRTVGKLLDERRWRSTGAGC
jgi:hypothetical protein